MSNGADYFMDDPREAARLREKVDADFWLSRYLIPHLNDTRTLLDVGCGPGAIVAAAAKVRPAIHVTGIELSTDRFATSVTSLPINASIQQGDARSLAFVDNSFDFVYCRFLLEYLSERQKAVQEMVRVCKPGGRILLQDLDGQLVWHFPADAELESMLSRVLAGLEKTGFDPFVGRKLFSMAKSAGLVDIQVQAESYHLYCGRIDDHNFGLWETKLCIAMPVATKMLGSEDAARSLKTRFLDYLRRDDTLTYCVMFTVVGTKPIT